MARWKRKEIERAFDKFARVVASAVLGVVAADRDLNAAPLGILDQGDV